ncbi:alpha,alpha-phosphotrehalase [uncultured Lacticaseibacillus sp.]|uniref:alpha,alpha-phosphotrehalase n=1 Tax=uncultured Lacticaseibacillus sp. TaxID=2775882 RepID=UPI002598218C|nr:alpha,alpha-phosphotrehalase [uncultured Lacticaseibacillus sp.]
MSFQNKVVYQLYPKSFFDSNGDGIGDLPGITAKMDYLQSLNVDIVWLNPFFVSPQNDNGYDVADYRAIDPRFGTMADFERMMAAFKAAGIGVMLDMVLNHTSTAHEWFQRALAGDKYYQDYYWIYPPKPNGDLPTNWDSKFGGPAWAPFGDTGNYYLHLYDRTQADLNWHNPHVRQEAADIVNFWRAKGVEHFRFDVMNVIGKDERLVDAPAGTESKFLYTDKPVVQRYIQDLAAQSYGQDAESVTVGEMSSTTLPHAIEYTRPDEHALSMIFQFHHLKTDYDHGEKWTTKRYDFNLLRDLLHHWATGLSDGGGWQALFWNNHDQPRALNRFGDVEHYRVRTAQVLAASIHLNRGTPYIYMGEEIGMTDPEYHTMDDYVDVEAHNAYRRLTDAGMAADDAFAAVHAKARDNSRTPMQWDGSENAGFTTGTPWLRSTNQATINVQNELASGAIFDFYQQLIALRKRYPVISMGDYTPYATDVDWVFGFIRQYGASRLLVLNNYAEHDVTIPVGAEWQRGRILISNVPGIRVTERMTLPAFSTVAILVGD